jgi:hypothetical protein
MVLIEVEASAAAVAREALALGVGIAPVGPTLLRAVFHLDVSHEDAEKAATLLLEAIGRAKTDRR